MSECCRCIYCVDNIKYLRPPLGVVLFVMNLIGLVLFFIPHRKSSSLIYSVSDEVFVEEEKSLPLSVHSIQRTPYEGDFFERVPSHAVNFDEKPRRRSSSLSHFSVTMDEIDKKLKEKLGKINSYEESPVHKMIRKRKQTLFPKPIEEEDSPVKDVILPKEEILPEKEKTPPVKAPSIVSFETEKSPEVESEKEKTPPPVKAPSFVSFKTEKSPEVESEKEISPDVEPVKEIMPEKEILPDKMEEVSPDQSKSVLEFLEEKSPESIKTIFTRRKDPSSLSFQSKHSSSPRSKKLRAGSSKSSVTSTSIGPDFEAMALTKIIRHELGYFVDKKYSPSEKNETIVQNNEIEFLNFHEELLKVQKRIETKLNSLLTNDPKCIYAKSLKQNFPSVKKTNEQKINDALHILESLKNKEKRKIQKIDQLRKKIVKKSMNPKTEVDSSDHVKPEPLYIKPSANEHGNIFNGIFDKSLSKDSYSNRLKNLKVLEGELRRISDIISVNINRLHSIFENHEKKQKNQVYSLNSCLISELPCKKGLNKEKKKKKKGPQVKKICRRFENGQIDSETQYEKSKISSENEFFSISKVLDLLETPKKFPENCSHDEKPDQKKGGQVAKVIEFSSKDSFWKSSFDIVLQYSDASNRIKY